MPNPATIMHQDMTNQEVAQLLETIAAALEIQEANQFRVRAYQTAAANIARLSQPLRILWQQEKLDEVDGLGEKITNYLDELFSTSQVKHFKKILDKLPAGMMELTDLEGVGPKTAYKLATEFTLGSGEKALQKIKKLAEQGALRNLEGLGEKSEQDIIQAIDSFFCNNQGRLLLAKAWNVAQLIMEYLQQSPAVQEVEVLGSLRRRRATIGDIDLAVKTNDNQAVNEFIHAYDGIAKIIATGPKMTRFQHQLGPQVDIKTQTPDKWGTMLQHFTGSKQHNVALRRLALQQGYSMSEYGLKAKNATNKNKNSKIRTFLKESTLYQALGLQYIPPELRENNGEIEAAQQGKLPKLVTLEQIKGDLHVHTNLDFPTSHDRGQSNITELLDQAIELGYSYLGFADHNPPQSGLSAAQRLKIIDQRNAAIDQAVSKWRRQHGLAHSDFHVFHGLEVDIKPDGSLALEDQALKKLDYVIASIHSSHQQNKEKITARYLKVIAHPLVTIIGHPTGRVLNFRQEVAADWEKIFAAAAKRNSNPQMKKIAFEINASPKRLDLPPDLQRLALQLDLPLIINSDAHQAASLKNMTYGVWMARRGWCEKQNILNTKINIWK